MFQAARRLEERFPLLNEFQMLSDAIGPCYSGILDPVAPVPYDKRAATARYDSKGSMLGGVMYENYEDTEKEVPTDFCIPLAQLDLDDIARTTGRNFGSGLLQVWARERREQFGEHFIRVIPREIVDRAKIPRDYSAINWLEEDVVYQAELEALSKTDPTKAEEAMYESHYSRGELGLDWLLSSYYDYESVPHGIPEDGAPLQIVGWENSWYLRNCILWDDIDFGNRSGFTQLYEDPDYLCVRAAFNRIHVDVSLFTECGLNVEPGWEDLFCFNGPLSSVKIDDHLIRYKTEDGAFQYSGTYCLDRF